MEFIKGMTFWNWLALIAFLFATISVLNAFLSLKSRFRDWRGIQSKKAFDKRVRQLERELKRIKRFAADPTTFYLYLLDKGTKLVVFFILSVGMFMTAFAISVSPFKIDLSPGIPLDMAIVLIAITVLVLI